MNKNLEDLLLVLEFYANEENYKNKIIHESPFPQYEPHTTENKILKDNGKLARGILDSYKK